MNRFKITILSLLVIIAAIVCYFLLFYIPSRDQKAFVLKSEAECGQQAKVIFDNLIKSKSSDYFKPELPDFQSRYNSIQNKCFVLISYTTGTTISTVADQNSELYDVYENNLLAWYMSPLVVDLENKKKYSDICTIGNSNNCQWSDFVTLVNSDMQSIIFNNN